MLVSKVMGNRPSSNSNIQAAVNKLSQRLLLVLTAATERLTLNKDKRCRSLLTAAWMFDVELGRKNSSSAHHRTTLSCYIFAAKAYNDNRKNLLNINISSTCHHNMVNFGPLTAENGRHPSKFQRVSRLGFVTAPTSLNGGQPNFARCLPICLVVSWAGTLCRG